MTPESQRIAIAEACPGKIRLRTHEYTGEHWCWRPDENHGWRACYLNDPLSDLNAMHEAEKVLEDFYGYAVDLAKVVGVFQEKGFPCILPGDSGAIAHATAAQRAEAFLRTLGLWT